MRRRRKISLAKDQQTDPSVLSEEREGGACRFRREIFPEQKTRSWRKERGWGISRSSKRRCCVSFRLFSNWESFANERLLFSKWRDLKHPRTFTSGHSRKSFTSFENCVYACVLVYSRMDLLPVITFCFNFASTRVKILERYRYIFILKWTRSPLTRRLALSKSFLSIFSLLREYGSLIGKMGGYFFVFFC